MCFNSVPTKESFFKGVYKLLPGEQLIIKDGKKKLETFFELSFDVKEDTLEGYAEKINNAMIDSVNHHLISDVEVGSFLSSGVDSSYLVSISKVKETFTVGYDNPKYDEISYAKDLADRLGINNTSRKISRKEYLDKFSEILYYMDEPLADPAAIALYFVSEVASKKVKVVTSGEGADELFGGYNSYDEELSQSWYMKIPFPIRRLGYYIAKALPDKWGLNFVYRRGQRLPEYYIGIGRVFRNEEALKYVNNKNQVDIKEITKPYFEKYKNESTFIQRQVIDYYFWLVNDFLHAVDRNTMMFGLEARTPFLDKEVYDVARTLTNSAKLTKETTKPALRLAAKKVIPNESYNKKKLGFPVPLREWIKEDDLYNKIKEAFASDVAAKYFKQNKLLKLLENNRKGKSDNYKKIWTIYTFLVWYNEFFIKEG